MECQALDTGEGDVFGYLNTEALESHDEHVGCAHALHGLVAQDIELSAVERLVDVVVPNDRFVDLHPGDQVDLGEPLFLQTWETGQ